MAEHSSRVRALRLMIAYAAVACYLASWCCCSGAHPKNWDAAKDSAGMPFMEFDHSKATEKTAVSILDDDASMHKNAAAESDQNLNQLTVLDELFSGTWGAFIVKENLGQNAERSPSTDSAELFSAGYDEVAAEDSNVEVGDFDHLEVDEARLVSDELPSEDVTVTTGDWPTGDAAAADRVAAEASADNASPGEQDASSIKIGHSRGKNSIRSHWRRGHDQAANLRRTTDAEPVASETVTDRRTSAEGSLLSPQPGHHVVTFRFSGPPDAGIAGSSPGRSHGAHVYGGSDAGGRISAAATTNETPAQRLPIDDLGQWGQFLPSVHRRRTLTDGNSKYKIREETATAEPGHVDRIRRPTLKPEQHQLSVGGRHDVLRSSGFALALRAHPSTPTPANQLRTALAITAPAQRTPNSSALADTEAGRAHPIAPVVVAAHNVDRDRWLHIASGSNQPSTAAAMAIDDGDGHSDGGRLPNPGGGRRVAADVQAAFWPELGAPLARRQRLPLLHLQREHGAAVGERGSGGESNSSSSWSSVGDEQQQVAIAHSTTMGDRDVHSRVAAATALAPSRGERRPRPRTTLEGRFVV